ncbi:hypothetical protein [Candidatus Phytoplasma tritici]|uniref:hypothetical protein n=1 Tax=Candidatus Phytoplasma tritici TaxID=321961 RepID=UPI000417E8CD|nr:hypothetical protein [Candidatus Phytoplasma tritici]
MLKYNIIVDKFNNFETYKSQFVDFLSEILSDSPHAKILKELPILEEKMQLGLDRFGGSIKLKERQNNMDEIIANFTYLKDQNSQTPSGGYSSSTDTSQNNNSNATNSFLFFFFVIFILLFVFLILYFIFQNFANTK